MTYPEWFLSNGIRVFPIKPKDKVPACKSWDDYTATPAETQKWVNYGVALGHPGGLAVTDTDTPEAEAWAKRTLPYTPFSVRTGKGVHRYYLIAQHAPNFIHRDGHTIEFRNHGQYVVGPGSLHKTGHVYTADPWNREFEKLPLFPVDTFVWDDRDGKNTPGIGTGEGYTPPREVAAGERHDQMYRILRSFQSRGLPNDACIEICVLMNRLICKPPLDEREVRKHLGRVCRVPDRKGWARRTPRDGWDVYLGLVNHDDVDENGMPTLLVPREVAEYAARSVDPKWDPDSEPPTDPGAAASGDAHPDVEEEAVYDDEEDENALDLMEDPS